MYMGLTVFFALLKSFPDLRKWATPIGLVTVSLSLGLASFATKTLHLILTQGVMYALGGCFAWCPVLFYLEEWWVRRRGFAYGTTIAGQAIAGAILPVVLEWLLDSYGFRTTLRVCALSFAVLTFPIIFFFKPRIPLSRATRSRSFDMSFWKNRNYLILQSGNVIQSLGYFLPVIYLPTFARSLGATNFEGILTVVLVNAAAFVGCMCMGLAVDKFHVTTCLLVSAVGSTISVFLLWGMSTSLPILYIFCLVYGAFAGCNSSSYSAMVRETRQRIRTADSGMVFACLSAGKGIGNLCSGPLSEALLKAPRWNASFVYGSGYGAMVTFTGVTAFVGGWGFLARRVGWL